MQIVFLLPESCYAIINTKQSTYNVLTRHKKLFMETLIKRKTRNYGHTDTKAIQVTLIIQRESFAKVIKRFLGLSISKNSAITQNPSRKLKKWSIMDSGLLFSQHPLSKPTQSS